VLVLDMIEILPPLGKYKYDTWRILPVKFYNDNSVRLWSCIKTSTLLSAHLLEYGSLSSALLLPSKTDPCLENV
jgi:hypothetical protein